MVTLIFEKYCNSKTWFVIPSYKAKLVNKSCCAMLSLDGASGESVTLAVLLYLMIAALALTAGSLAAILLLFRRVLRFAFNPIAI